MTEAYGAAFKAFNHRMALNCGVSFISRDNDCARTSRLKWSFASLINRGILKKELLNDRVDTVFVDSRCMGAGICNLAGAAAGTMTLTGWAQIMNMMTCDVKRILALSAQVIRNIDERQDCL